MDLSSFSHFIKPFQFWKPATAQARLGFRLGAWFINLNLENACPQGPDCVAGLAEGIPDQPYQVSSHPNSDSHMSRYEMGFSGSYSLSLPGQYPRALSTMYHTLVMWNVCFRQCESLMGYHSYAAAIVRLGRIYHHRLEDAISSSYGIEMGWSHFLHTFVLSSESG